jgi:hypothetical protein
MENRALRRRHLRTVEKRSSRRVRGEYAASSQALLGLISVEPVLGDAADQAFVSHMKIAAARESGLPAVAWSAGAVYLVAKRTLTGERVGCMAVTIMPPEGKALIEDFFVVPGRYGRIAAYAMIERLRALKAPKVGFVSLNNPAMLGALEAFGMRVTGYIVEGG